jgi:hypothetical protein
MQGTIDKYEELFVIVSYLLEEGSLNAASAEIKEFNRMMELALDQASIALIKIIRKSDIAPDRKVLLEKEIKKDLQNDHS